MTRVNRSKASPGLAPASTTAQIRWCHRPPESGETAHSAQAAVPLPPQPQVERFETSPRAPVFVEVFCCLARLSKAARNLGFIEQCQWLKCCKWTYPLRLAQLKGLLENPDVRWVHWASPCGTFSRARETKRKGAPKPLRNLQHIKGFLTSGE